MLISESMSLVATLLSELIGSLCQVDRLRSALPLNGISFRDSRNVLLSNRIFVHNGLSKHAARNSSFRTFLSLDDVKGEWF